MSFKKKYGWYDGLAIGDVIFLYCLVGGVENALAIATNKIQFVIEDPEADHSIYLLFNNCFKDRKRKETLSSEHQLAFCQKIKNAGEKMGEENVIDKILNGKKVIKIVAS